MVKKTLEDEIWEEIMWRKGEIKSYQRQIEILKLALKQLAEESGKKEE